MTVKIILFKFSKIFSLIYSLTALKRIDAKTTTPRLYNSTRKIKVLLIKIQQFFFAFQKLFKNYSQHDRIVQLFPEQDYWYAEHPQIQHLMSQVYCQCQR